MIIIDENSLGRFKGLQLTMRYSISGEQMLEVSFTLEEAHQSLLMKKHTLHPFDFPNAAV